MASMDGSSLRVDGLVPPSFPYLVEPERAVPCRAIDHRPWVPSLSQCYAVNLCPIFPENDIPGRVLVEHRDDPDHSMWSTTDHTRLIVVLRLLDSSIPFSRGAV